MNKNKIPLNLESETPQSAVEIDTIERSPDSFEKKPEGAKRANFEKLFGVVEPHEISGDDTLANSPHAWVKNLETEGPPRGFNQLGWKPWSTDHIAKNFALLQKALEDLHLNPAQKAAMTGYILHKNYEIGTGHADVLAIRVIPQEVEGTCTLEFVYDRYRDVREEKELNTARQTLKITIGKTELASAKKEGYELAGITDSGIDRVELSRTLISTQQGLNNSPVRRAYITYDSDKGVLTVDAAIIGRNSKGRAQSHGSVPVAVIEEGDFFSPKEIEMLKAEKDPTRRHAAIQKIIADKSDGLQLEDYISLNKIPAAERTLTHLTELASTFIEAAIADRLRGSCVKNERQEILRLIKEWREEIFQDAMRLFDAENLRATQGAIGYIKRIFIKPVDTEDKREKMEQLIWGQICVKRPIAQVQTTVDWIRGYSKIQPNAGEQSTAIVSGMTTKMTFAPQEFSIQIPGHKNPLKVFHSETTRKGTFQTMDS